MMDDEKFQDFAEGVAQSIDLVGIGVIVIGLLIATAFAAGAARRDSFQTAYRGYRQQVGKSILLGLEFLVAADIIRTVAVSPTFRGVGVLAVIVAVRTFLSFTLEVELEGRWPWQKARTARAESG